VLNDVINLDPK